MPCARMGRMGRRRAGTKTWKQSQSAVTRGSRRRQLSEQTDDDAGPSYDGPPPAAPAARPAAAFASSGLGHAAPGAVRAATPGLT